LIQDVDKFEVRLTIAFLMLLNPKFTQVEIVLGVLILGFFIKIDIGSRNHSKQ
jgi:hypothetical protein